MHTDNTCSVGLVHRENAFSIDFLEGLVMQGTNLRTACQKPDEYLHLLVLEQTWGRICKFLWIWVG